MCSHSPKVWLSRDIGVTSARKKQRDLDPEKAQLVERIKSFQRAATTQKETWYSFCGDVKDRGGARFKQLSLLSFKGQPPGGLNGAALGIDPGPILVKSSGRRLPCLSLGKRQKARGRRAERRQGDSVRLKVTKKTLSGLLKFENANVANPVACR